MNYPAFMPYPADADAIGDAQLRRMRQIVDVDAIIREYPEEYKRIQRQEGKHGHHREMDQ